MDRSNSLSNLLRSGLSWTIIVEAIIALLNFSGQIWFAWILGVEIIGQYAILVLSIELSRLPFDFGFNLSVIHHQASARIFRAALTLVLLQIVGLISIWIIFIIVYSNFYNNDIQNVFYPGIILLFAQIAGLLTTLISAHLESLLNYRFLSCSRLIVTILGLAIACSTALAGGGIYSLLLRDFIISVSFLTFVWVRVRPRMIPEFSLAALAPVLRFSMRVWGLNVLERAAKRLDYAFVGIVLGRDSLGIYYQLRGIMEGLLGFLVKPVQTVFYAFYCRHHDPNSLLVQILKMGSLYILIIALASSIFAAFTGEWILINSLGDEWAIGSPLLPGFMIYLWTLFWFENIKVLAISMNYHYLPILGRILQIMSLILLTLPMTKYYGFFGSGIASGISSSVLTGTTFFLLMRATLHTSFHKKEEFIVPS